MLARILNRWAARRVVSKGLDLRQYAAAKSGRSNYGWTPVDGTVNEEIRTSSPQVRRRVRQLVRDFGPFSRAVGILEDLVVGPDGFRWQSRHERRRELEASFAAWCENADVAGQLHFCELQQLAERQLCECGEYLFLIHADRSAWAPFQLQAIEPDRLSCFANGTNIEQGVEYDPLTGRRIAYHLDQGEYSRKVVRVEASRILHGFHHLRPGQLRGISPFAAGVLLAHDLDQYMAAEIDTAKLAAKYLAFVKTPDATGFQEARGATEEDGQQIEEMENAIIEYLNPGEDVTIASNPRPGSGFEPFVRFVLRMLSITTGVPYDILSGDYSQSNYSSARLARNDFSASVAVMQRRGVRHLCTPVLRMAMDAMVMAGRLDVPGYWSRALEYQDGKWITPGLPAVDPLKESKAERDQIDGTLRSEMEVCAARGRDYEDVLDELALGKQMREARNLTVEDVSTALAGNPAAITDEE